MTERARIPSFLLLLALLFGSARRGSAQQFPEGLAGSGGETIGRLSLLYGLDPGVAGTGVVVELAPGNPPRVPPGWGSIPSFAAGLAEPAAGRILLVPSRMGHFPFGDAAQTLRHELSHVLLRRSLGFVPPRWFDEGLAMRISGEWEGNLSVAALGSGGVGRLRLARIEEDFRAGESEVRRSYDLARGFVASLFPTGTDVTGFLIEARSRGSFNATFLLRFGETPEEAFDRWTSRMPFLLRLIAVVGTDALVFGAGAFLIPLGAWLVRGRKRERLRRMEERERRGGEPDPEPPPIEFPEEGRRGGNSPPDA